MSAKNRCVSESDCFGEIESVCSECGGRLVKLPSGIRYCSECGLESSDEFMADLFDKEGTPNYDKTSAYGLGTDLNRAGYTFLGRRVYVADGISGESKVWSEIRSALTRIHYGGDDFVESVKVMYKHFTKVLGWKGDSINNRVAACIMMRFLLQGVQRDPAEIAECCFASTDEVVKRTRELGAVLVDDPNYFDSAEKASLRENQWLFPPKVDLGSKYWNSAREYCDKLGLGEGFVEQLSRNVHKVCDTLDCKNGSAVLASILYVTAQSAGRKDVSLSSLSNYFVVSRPTLKKYAQKYADVGSFVASTCS